MNAVIFDMNGVIIVDQQFHNQAWLEFCKKYHFSLTETEIKTQVMGKRDQDILDYLFKKKLSKEEINRYSDERYGIAKKLVEGKLTLPESLTGLLNNLQNMNVPLAIATSAIKEYTDFIMNKFELRKYFL